MVEFSKEFDEAIMKEILRIKHMSDREALAEIQLRLRATLVNEEEMG